MSKLLRLPALLLVALLALAFDASAAAAQKALVYCPTDELETCGTVVAALGSTGAYPEGVDKAYDGSNGTVDLRTADLFAYTLFVVPSLSDDEEGTPLALLRDATVAGRLKLARWAGANFDAVRGPGLVVLQDNSDVEATRYDWVRGLTGLTVTADVALKTYSSVRTMTATGMAILSSGGTQLAYDNMASFGFYFPSGAPGLSLDAVGQTGTSVGGQVVLVTAEGANTGGATITTAKDDYAPGETVAMTGTGFGASESVTITLHEDPLVHNDRTFTTTANAQGGFVFSGFAPEQHDVDVRFIVTAKGQASGRQAQTTFTDGPSDYGIDITPSSATSGALQSYVLRIWNASDNGSNTIGSANVTVPTGWSVSTPLATPTGAPNPRSWTASLASGVIQLRTTANNQRLGRTNGSNAADTLKLTFTATAPSPASSTVYTWSAVVRPTNDFSGVADWTLKGSPATVTVGAACIATAVTTHPSNQSITYGSDATFTAAASGTAPVAVQWQSRPDGGSPWTNVSGALSSTLTVTKPAVAQSGTQYQAVFTNGCGTATSNAATLSVAAKGLTVTGVTATGHEYDGTTSATLNTGSATLVGVISPDVVTLNASGATASFANASVGTAKPVTVAGLTLGGAAAGNYTLTQPAATADIQPRTLTASFTAAGKTYDGTTAAVINGRSVSNKIGTEDVNISGGTATFDNANVGTGKTVTATGFTLTGADAANYTLGAVTSWTTTASVTQAALTVVVASQTRAYNQPNPPFTGTLTGVLAGDGITAAYATTATQTSAVGAYPITATLADPNGKLANYAVTNTPGTLTITKADQTIAFTQPADPVYGAAPVNVTGTATSGLPVAFATTGTACSVATGGGSNLLAATSAGSCTITASQPGDANYNVAPSVSYTLNVAQKSIGIGSVTVANKPYDGTTAATITASTLAAGSAVGGDAVGITGGTATFANANVGTGKTVNVTGLTLTGAQAGNYVLASGTTTTTADITALTVTPAVTVANKQYDGGTSATIQTATVTGAIAGDQVTLTGGTATFGTKTVGTAKPVSITGLTLGGAQAGNYLLSATTASATADITAKSIDVGTVTVADKVYDGNTTATITNRTLVTGGVIGTDVVSLTGGSASFATKAAGTNKSVSITGLSLDGADAGNYALSATTASATANITAKSVTASITASPKVYDGTTDASATGSVGGTISPDVVTVTVSGAAFDTKDVGTNKPVTATVALGGADAANYALTATTAATTASITAKALAIASVTANDKVYDGTTAATFSAATLAAGVFGTDAVSLTGGTATFDTKSVGTGKTVTVTGFSLTGAQASNYTLTSATATSTASITARTISGSTIVATSKEYDGSRTAVVTGTLGSGKVTGDELTLGVSDALFDTKDVGTGKTVSANLMLIGADKLNYALASSTATTTANISAKALVGSFTASNKVYDATTAATVATTSLPGVIAPDAVTLSVTNAAFANKNVGTGKTVTADLALAGTGSGNYTVNATANTTADITAATVNGTFTASNKVYDGNASATIATRTIGTGVLSNDVVTLTGGSAAFDNKNVGTGKTVTGTGFTLGGADGGNYVIGTVPTTTANVTAAALVPAITASNKTYDATTAATIASRSLTGVIGSDAVTLESGTATFADKNVGTGKTVTGSGFSLTGNDAGNYVLSPLTATTTANITKATATATVTAANKVYDGNTNATASIPAGGGLTGILGSDQANLVLGSASFASKTAATGKTVTVSVSLSGTDAGNYALTSPVTTTADITPKSVTGTITAADKVYDGNTTATVTPQVLAGLVGGDAAVLTVTAADFDTKNVGTNKTVTATGLSLTGADAGSYVLSATTAATTAKITPATVTGAFTAASKTYDGNVTATITNRSITSGVVATETVTLEGGSATFANKSVGTGKTVTGTGFTIGGSGASNYVLGTVATTTADITAKAITGSFTAGNKVYDNSTTATILTRTLNGTIGGDAITLYGGTATFDTKNVGTGKTVTLAGATLSGADAGNYNLTSVGTTTANITALGITGSFTAANKVYDGNTSATVNTRGLNGVLGMDAVTLDGGTAAFDTKNVGNGKTVTLTGATLAGNDAGNYSLTSVGTTTANITALGITGSFTADNKVYDGNKNATVLTRTPNGVLNGDAVTLTGGTATFDTKNVGTGKTVTLAGATLAGAQADNYSLASVGTTTASITARALVVTATGVNKIFDNTTAATVTLSDNRVTNDVFTTSYTSASFATASVGTNKPVSVSGIAIAGTDAGNYTANTTANTTANITAKEITVVVNSLDRQYSDPNPTLTGTVSGIVANDATVGVAYATAATPTSNVGTYPITASLTGSGAGNYTLSAPNGTLTITKENSSVVYSGLMNVPTSSPTSATATINLVASVTDASAFPTGDAQYDPNAGDVRTATVDFLKEDGTPIAGCTNRPVALVNAGDTKVGTATCPYSVNIGNADGLPFGVDIVVNGNYAGAEETIINVYKPLDAFITGGGYLAIANTSGQYAADRASKTNFGFNVKYNKSGTNQQGNVNIIFRRTVNGVVRTYQIKSNAISSLTSDARNLPYTGSFVGKANLMDVTNPNAPITISGNLDLQLSMTDNGNGIDLLAIQLMSGNALWYSSNWTGGKTAEQALTGGNLVVR